MSDNGLAVLRRVVPDSLCRERCLQLRHTFAFRRIDCVYLLLITPKRISLWNALPLRLQTARAKGLQRGDVSKSRKSVKGVRQRLPSA